MLLWASFASTSNDELHFKKMLSSLNFCQLMQMFQIVRIFFAFAIFSNCEMHCKHLWKAIATSNNTHPHFAIKFNDIKLRKISGGYRSFWHILLTNTETLHFCSGSQKWLFHLMFPIYVRILHCTLQKIQLIGDFPVTSHLYIYIFSRKFCSREWAFLSLLFFVYQKFSYEKQNGEISIIST